MANPARLIDLGSIRQAGAPAAPDPSPADVDFSPDLVPDETKPSVSIELPDGSISISFGKPDVSRPLHDAAFDANLAESLADVALASIANELLQGIEEDDRSRREWLEERAEGIKLLALKIERPSSSSAGMGAGVDNTSRSRDTLLLEAALRFQANASAELLPADGPLKIENKLSTDTLESDDLAETLEDDLNYWLTEVASEYYPDTERMLLWTGVGGSGFKKVYRCPIRQRPVSESVDAADLIVSNQATDLRNADRVTFVTRMPQTTLRRMKFLKVYRDIELSSPGYEIKTAVEEAKEEVTGVVASMRPEDMPHTIYECYCQISVEGDEHRKNGEITGLPRPYKVTIDKASQAILEIRRNWRKDDELERPREIFVKFPYVPGFGFYEIGLIQIAGNPTVALTALLRVMVDSGIYANFPGGVAAKSATKQNTMDLSVAPGQFQMFDTSAIADGDIRKAVMAMPYHEPGPAIMSLFQSIKESGSRVAGTAEISVGEGRQDAPVGTTIALIEQAIKVLNAVHKRLHRAQAKEFQLLRDLFLEYPEDFIKFNSERDSNWDRDKLMKALGDYNLVPRADPNTASHVQRVMRAQALYQMAQAHPEFFQIMKVIEYVLRVIGIDNPASLTQQPQPAGQQPDLKGQAAETSAQADLVDAQTKAKKLEFDMANAKTQDQNRDQDRNAELEVAKMRLAGEQLKAERGEQHETMRLAQQHAHESRENMMDRQAQAMQPAPVKGTQE